MRTIFGRQQLAISASPQTPRTIWTIWTTLLKELGTTGCRRGESGEEGYEWENVVRIVQIARGGEGWPPAHAVIGQPLAMFQRGVPGFHFVRATHF
jgi:hypothetical protein